MNIVVFFLSLDEDHTLHDDIFHKLKNFNVLKTSAILFLHHEGERTNRRFCLYDVLWNLLDTE